jgi:hypothetical protein
MRIYPYSRGNVNLKQIHCLEPSRCLVPAMRFWLNYVDLRDYDSFSDGRTDPH